MLSFAIENFSELFGYIATGRVNIRIHKEGGPPNNPSGKPANLPVPNGTCPKGIVRRAFGRERPAGKPAKQYGG